MGTRQGLVRIGQRVVALVTTVLLFLGTVSCAKPTEPTQLISEPTVEPNRLTSKLAEVSPPETIQTLKQIIDAYTPQVRILSPRPGEIVEDTSVSLRVQVRGLPLFKDETFGLGPHLHVFLDNEPYKAVYDLSEPLEFKDLSPGTHTLRVFASRPWHESFKNQGAFDQRTFHIYAPTPQDELSAQKPVLTYSRPQGSYGAEPIMLDFYLTNAPLHMTAQEEPKDDIHDWRIRCTVNGQSFVFDEWQAVYLKGFEPGRNWVQLELIDEAGHSIDNRFNNTVRVIDYEPGGDDALAKLVRGELGIKEVAGIIDPTYEPPVEAEPELEEPATEAEPTAPAVPEAGQPPSEGETTPTAEQPQIPEKEAVPAEEAPEPSDQEAVPAEPQAPAPVLPPVTPEAVEEVPETSQPSEFDQDATPETKGEITEEEPEAEAQVEIEKSEEEFLPGPKTPAADVNQPEASPSEEGQSIEAEGDVVSPTEEETFEKDDASSAVEVPAVEKQGKEVEVAPLAEDEAATERDHQAKKPGKGLPPEAEQQEETADSTTGNKLLERYKQWQKRRQSAQQKSEQPIPEPDSDRVDVFLSPDSAEIPKLDIPEDGDSSESRMEMPELVEPYLTEPYLTEPRLDVEDPQESNEQSGSAAKSPNSKTDQQESDTQKDSAAQPNSRSAPISDKPFI